MKKKNVLLIENDPRFVVTMHSQLAFKYNLLATGDPEIVWNLLKKSSFSMILIQLPPEDDELKHKKLKKILKRINRSKYADIPKVLIDVEGKGDRVPEYLKLNVSAAVNQVKGLEKIWGVEDFSK